MRAIDRRILVILAAAVSVTGFGLANAAADRHDSAAVARGYAGDIARVQSAAATTPSPRLILAGGSNVVYGLDTQVFRATLGVPVINAGMYSKLNGDGNFADYLLSIVGSGDVVLLSDSNWLWPAPSSGRRSRERDEARLAAGLTPLTSVSFVAAARADWPRWSLFPSRPWAARWTRADRQLERRYAEADGNAADCAPDPALLEPLALPTEPLNAETLRSTARLVGALRRRGATVLLSLPPTLIAADAQRAWGDRAQSLDKLLGQVAPVVHDGRAVVFSDRRGFCDAPTHLSPDGRAARTAALARTLASRPEIALLRRRQRQPPTVRTPPRPVS